MTTTVEPDDQPTFQCRHCSRRFIQSSLEKHEPACKKLTKMQRKVFDSGKQRAIGSDIPLKDIRKAAKEREKAGGVFPRPQTHWRERHEEFMGVVSASKQVGQALKTGAPLPPPPKTALHADYVRCEFCARTFNKNAAERHIEFCKEQNARRTVASKAVSRQNSTSSRQKTGSSTASSGSRQPPQPPQLQQQRQQNGLSTAAPASSKTPSTASSSRGSRPSSAGRQRPPPTATAAAIVPAQGVVQIGGAAVDAKQLSSKLPQPTSSSKRSNSAPRVVPLAAPTAVSKFSTPKSAGNASSKGKGQQPQQQQMTTVSKSQASSKERKPTG